MTLFSLNINKIALLRNSRGGTIPDLCTFAQMAIDTGLKGLTVHPRADARHITMDDVIALSELEAIKNGDVEFNIEGDLRPDLVNLVETIQPSQFTVVPVRPGEVTSNRGWRAYDDHRGLSDVVKRLEAIRVAVFCDATHQSCDYVIDAGAHGVELYTGPYAEAFHKGDYQTELDAIVSAGRHVKSAGLRLNGGHDLSLGNLPTLLKHAPFDEFSIGHQVVTDALIVGWQSAVSAYIDVISPKST